MSTIIPVPSSLVVYDSGVQRWTESLAFRDWLNKLRLLVNAGGAGTVTEVDTTEPIHGGPITTTGTLSLTGAPTVKGDLWTYNGVTFVSVGVGSNTQVLTADSTAAAGFKWAPGGTGSGSVTSVATTDPIHGGTITTTGTISLVGAPSVKGDIWTYTGGTWACLGVGLDGYFLTADSSKTTGLNWVKTGTLQGQEFTSSGTFNVPVGVTCVWVSMVAGGGGGSCTISAATGGGGGGAGETIQNHPVLVTSGGTVTVTIGAKGTGGATGQASAQAGTNGGDTSFGSITLARGGKGALSTGVSGSGGGTGGSATKSTGSPGNVGTLGTIEACTFFGGASGGGGGAATGSSGGAGGPAGGYPTGGAAGVTASTQAGGGGGANTIYGVGGAAGNGGAVGTSAAATSYGSGGGGAGGRATTTLAAGDGAPGYLLVQWVA